MSNTNLKNFGHDVVSFNFELKKKNTGNFNLPKRIWINLLKK